MATDPVVNAEFGAPKPGEVALRLIGACAVISLELARVVDPPHRKGRMQDVPSAGFVGMDFGSIRHGSPDRRDRFALA
jgi:hypothetical protein